MRIVAAFVLATLFLFPGCVRENLGDAPAPAEAWVYNPVNRKGNLDVALGVVPQSAPEPSCVTMNALNSTEVFRLHLALLWTPSQDAARTLSVSVQGPNVSDAREGPPPLVLELPPFNLTNGQTVEIRIEAPSQTIPATPPASQPVDYQLPFQYTRLSHEPTQEIRRLMFPSSTACGA